MNRDLVSIIIPTHGRSDKIGRALESVFAQTYQNFEVIVVDDNADSRVERDRTQSVVQKFPSVKLIQNAQNLGGALTRNVGIEAATGKYIAFLDDDDFYKPDKIKCQYDLFCKMHNENIGLVICNTSYPDLPQNTSDLLYMQMIRHIALTSTWFTSREILRKVGCFEDSPSEQDAILLLKIIAAGYQIFTIPEKLVVFQDHVDEESISGHKLSNIAGLENFRDWCRKFYKLIDDKRIKDVEYGLSVRLCSLELINGMRPEATIELKKIIKTKPFNELTFKSVIKFCLPHFLLSRRYRHW